MEVMFLANVCKREPIACRGGGIRGFPFISTPGQSFIHGEFNMSNLNQIGLQSDL